VPRHHDGSSFRLEQPKLRKWETILAPKDFSLYKFSRNHIASLNNEITNSIIHNLFGGPFFVVEKIFMVLE
jgi:hypothetical protein